MQSFLVCTFCITFIFRHIPFYPCCSGAAPFFIFSPRKKAISIFLTYALSHFWHSIFIFVSSLFFCEYQMGEKKSRSLDVKKVTGMNAPERSSFLSSRLLISHSLSFALSLIPIYPRLTSSLSLSFSLSHTHTL